MAVASTGAADIPQARQAFDLRVPFSPTPVRTGDRALLGYELHLTNFASRTLLIERVRVIDAEGGRTLMDLTGGDLAAILGRVGRAPRNQVEVPPGGRAVAYVNAPIEEGAMPGALRHIVDYMVAGEHGSDRGTVHGGEIAVDHRPVPVLLPPLRGGPWVAVYDPGLERGHRRVFYALGGRARIPGRFAIDWMPAGLQRGGRGESGLGAEVLAVADGVVASTRDGVPEPAPGAARPRVGMADAAGNYVSIDLGDGRFAFYEHLMPGLRVKPGQRVRGGEVIGRLGSTGEASRPHLHFHVADADSPLVAEGLPYMIAGARVVGTYASIAAFEAGGPWQAAEPGADQPAFPRPHAIMVFPDGS